MEQFLYPTKSYFSDAFYFGHALQHAELPRPGMEPVPLALGAQSLNHWTTREVPLLLFKGG